MKIYAIFIIYSHSNGLFISREEKQLMIIIK